MESEVRVLPSFVGIVCARAMKFEIGEKGWCGGNVFEEEIKSSKRSRYCLYA